MNNFTYVLSHIRQNVVVLKIERYGTGLTQGYNTDGSSGLWAPGIVMFTLFFCLFNLSIQAGSVQIFNWSIQTFKSSILTFNSAIQTFNSSIQTFNSAIQTFNSATETFYSSFKHFLRQFKHSIRQPNIQFGIECSIDELNVWIYNC